MPDLLSSQANLPRDPFDKRFSEFIEKMNRCIDSALGFLVRLTLFLLACYGLWKLLRRH